MSVGSVVSLEMGGGGERRVGSQREGRGNDVPLGRMARDGWFVMVVMWGCGETWVSVKV